MNAYLSEPVYLQFFQCPAQFKGTFSVYRNVVVDEKEEFVPRLLYISHNIADWPVAVGFIEKTIDGAKFTVVQASPGSLNQSQFQISFPPEHGPVG